MRLSIPSPSRGEVHLGPFPLRGYALCIILGVIAAVIIGEKRLQKRGYPAGKVADIAVWAVPFGLVGGRLYSVITDNELYFRKGERPITALYVWNGGLGIWGAVALGALGAYIGARRNGVEFRKLADSLAPAIPVGQAIGRWGNWFNQELYGRPTHLPWAVHIDLAHRIAKYAGIATYQPTFLYESIWDLGTAGVVLWAERHFRLGRGRAFAVYVATYCVGRSWIEYLRIDPAHRFFGLRLNDWTCLILFLLAALYLYTVRDPALQPPAGDGDSRVPVLVGGPPPQDFSAGVDSGAVLGANVGGADAFGGPPADMSMAGTPSAGTSGTATVGAVTGVQRVTSQHVAVTGVTRAFEAPAATQDRVDDVVPEPDLVAAVDGGLLGWPQSGSAESSTPSGPTSGSSGDTQPGLGWPAVSTSSGSNPSGSNPSVPPPAGLAGVASTAAAPSMTATSPLATAADQPAADQPAADPPTDDPGDGDLR